MMRRRQGRMVISRTVPRPLAQAVGALFGRTLQICEKATLFKRGKPLASTYRKA